MMTASFEGKLCLQVLASFCRGYGSRVLREVSRVIGVLSDCLRPGMKRSMPFPTVVSCVLVHFQMMQACRPGDMSHLRRASNGAGAEVA